MIKKTVISTFILAALFFNTALPTKAADWVRLNIMDTPLVVYLDHDSISRNSGNLYYVIRHKNSEGVEKLIYIKSNTSAGKIGVIKTKDYDMTTYVSPKNWSSAKVFMKKFDEDSFLKQVNEFAENEVLVQKAMAARQLRKESLDTAKQELYKKYNEKYPGMKDYIITLEKNIKSNWKPPLGSSAGVTKVQFKVARDGKLVSSEIKQSAGNLEYDKKALDAVKNSAPFAKFPDGADKNLNDISVILTFDYYVMDVNKK